MDNSTKTQKNLLVITKCALVMAIYIVLTIMPPLNAISYGAIQCRLSEMLNFLVLKDRKYIISITIGCAIANIYSFGPIDMIVGSAASLVFLCIGRAICDKIEHRFAKYAIFSLVMSIAIAPIAAEIAILFKADFAITFLTMFVGEMISMTVGAFIMLTIGKIFKKTFF
jgi:uncharacterized membrane protein